MQKCLNMTFHLGRLIGIVLSQGGKMKSASVIVFALFSGYSLADEWTGPVSITDIQVKNSRHINIKVAPLTKAETCGRKHGFLLNGSSPNTDMMYAKILSSRMIGERVTLKIKDCGEEPEIKAIGFLQPKL